MCSVAVMINTLRVNCLQTKKGKVNCFSVVFGLFSDLHLAASIEPKISSF